MIKQNDGPYTGIIKTWPFRGGSVGDRRDGYRLVSRMINDLRRDRIEHIFTSMAQIPKVEVLHCYILIGGRIRWRANIAGFEPGGERECVDGQVLYAANWMILTGRVMRAPVGLTMKGFQGFRYCGGLW